MLTHFRSLSPLSLAVLLTAAACGESLTEPEPEPVPGAVADRPLDAATRSGFKDRVEFSNTQLWACSNEVVDFEGWFSVTVHEVVSSSGGTLFRLHVTTHVKGVGQTSGDKYVSNEVVNLTEHSNGAGFVSTFQFRINRISRGDQQDSAGWIKAHMTFNASGELTASKDEAAFDVCRS